MPMRQRGRGPDHRLWRVTATVAYSPAVYSSQTDDQFSSPGDLGHYPQLQSSVTSGTGEVAPTWSIGDGLASATASESWFGFLVFGTASASGQVDRGGSGISAGQRVGQPQKRRVHRAGEGRGSDYTMAWYNSYYHTVR